MPELILANLLSYNVTKKWILLKVTKFNHIYRAPILWTPFSASEVASEISSKGHFPSDLYTVF